MIYAMAKRVKQRNDARSRLTIPDLILLSLLAERPMHGYEINVTLEERKIRDWAPVSRPQIYYSLGKLENLGLVSAAQDVAAAAGPERRVVATNSKGRDLLAAALEDEHWIVDRVYQPFLIWLALSWQTRGRAFVDQLERRKAFLIDRLADLRETLDAVMEEVGHPHHEAVWMLELVIGETEFELQWIDKIRRNADKRAPARNKKER